MKRLISITLAAFLVIGLSSTSFAQIGTGTATAAASASVEAPITVSSSQDIAYNTLNTSTTGDQAPGTPGQFTVSGTSGASVSLSFTKSNLTHASSGSGDRTLVLNLANSGGTEDGAWEDTESSDFSSAGNKFFLGGGTNAIIPSTSGNDIVIWANPTVTVDGTEVPGSYSGSVTLTASYN